MLRMSAGEEERGRRCPRWPGPQLVPEAAERRDPGTGADHHEGHVLRGEAERRRPRARQDDVVGADPGTQPVRTQAKPAALARRHLAPIRQYTFCPQRRHGVVQVQSRVAHQRGADVHLVGRGQRRGRQRERPRALPRAVQQEGTQVEVADTEGGPELPLRPTQVLVLDDLHGGGVGQEPVNPLAGPRLESRPDRHQHLPRGGAA
mmetsp:Transcript_58475/g.165158  ORF Transcript_58475/g.165158 Transcript_58475/m.165158 type:complete len:205 (-) Transcript_58475:1326-1940(-)